MVVIRATAMAMMATTEVTAPEAAVVEVMVTTLKAVESNTVMIRQQQQQQQQRQEKTAATGKNLLEILPTGQIPPEAVVVLQILHT